MLPRVKIDFANGALGQVSVSPDGVFGLLTTASPVVDKLELLKSYVVKSMDDVTNTLGVTAANNPGLHKVLTEFYNTAGEGTELWLRCFAETVSLTDMATLSTANGIRDLLQDANGRLRGVFIHRTPAEGYTPTISEGVDGDVATAKAAAQLTAEWSTQTLKAPIFLMIAGLYYSGNPVELADLTTGEQNRVGIFLGDTVSGNGCAIGILAGRLAAIPVHRNIGRVKDGAAVTLTSAYLGDTKAELADAGSVHDKGYITFRMHTGRSGYYFTDDPLATLPTDDYNHVTARRTVDKAYRLAYGAMLNELLEEIPVSDEGQVSVTFAKGLETLAENAVINSMTVNGELGNDPENQNDTGVECLVDTNQNIVSTGFLKVGLRVKPYGYARYINVELGFKTISQ
ncbi:MAG: DUF2586 domain-containing protein [Bacteroidales bacterium]|nr:DUF2586 domain-containing protein [Bacteroidales bacterium]